MRFLVLGTLLALAMMNCNVGTKPVSKEKDKLVSKGKDLTGQVFILTDAFDQQKCEADAIDFGFSELFFLANNEFVLETNYETSSYFKGTYTCKNTELILTFGPDVVDYVFNEDTETGDYVLQQQAPDRVEFNVGKCNDKPLLVNTTRSGFDYGIQLSSEDGLSKLEELRMSKAWKLLKGQ